MVNSRDVARVAGVSQASVSRVLRDSVNVAPQTRRRVLRALEETGYTPNVLAQAMKTQRTGTVGVVVASVTNPFYPQMLEAVGARLAAAGRRMILWDSEGPGEESAVEAIRQGLIDGVLFTTATAASAPLAEALDRRSPVVLVHRSVDGAPCDQVTCDNVGGGGAVARYFAAAAHTRIGMIGGPREASTAGDRERGFRQQLAEYGSELPPAYYRRGDFSHDGAYAAMSELARLDPAPTAVFCVNDLTAFGALDAARSLEWPVPEDVWIVGFDDIAMASWAAFDLTTVRQPIPEMVTVAVAALIERIEDTGRPPEHRRFPSQLIVRGSTGHTASPEAHGRLAVPDGGVTSAP